MYDPFDTDDNCTEPELGRRVFRWALLRGKVEAEPEDQLVRDHIKSCPCCRQAAEVWKQKAAAAKVLEEGRRVIAGQLLPDELVTTKPLATGTAYFKFLKNAPTIGVLVIVDKDGHISRVDSAVGFPVFEAL